MRGSSARSVVVVVALTSVGACAPETPGRTDAEPGDSATWFLEELDVRPRVDLACAGTATAGPPDEYEVVAGVVALPASPGHPALQTSRRRSADGNRYFFAKTGLIWNTSASFELVVPEEQRPRMAIGWGGPAPRAHAISIDCAGAQQWVGLPGGYWVTEPLCADLIVRVDGREHTIQLGLGTPCLDQAGPQGPSDA